MKSDTELKRQVEDELVGILVVDITDIGVEVRDRVVTLSGTQPATLKNSRRKRLTTGGRRESGRGRRWTPLAACG